MSSNDQRDETNHHAGDAPHRLTHDDVDDLPPDDCAHLLAWVRHHRRLWFVAVPGLGLIAL